jgi:hypothetical protein
VNVPDLKNKLQAADRHDHGERQKVVGIEHRELIRPSTDGADFDASIF